MLSPEFVKWKKWPTAKWKKWPTAEPLELEMLPPTSQIRSIWEEMAYELRLDPGLIGELSPHITKDNLLHFLCKLLYKKGIEED